MSEEFELSEYEMAVLEAILKGKKGVKDISKYTGLPETVTSAVIKKLNEKGYLRGTEPAEKFTEFYERSKTEINIKETGLKFLDMIILIAVIVFLVYLLEYSGII